jgi:dTDP-4-amino-4,6-dideoxygalactose transaminase
MAIRHQLAVYSPIPVGAPLRGVAAALRLAADPRPALIDVLQRELDATSVVLVGSGTQALQIAITHAVRRAGGETAVALPAFSCFDVASAAIGANVSTALYDLDPDTLGPDLASFERVLSSGARVAVVAPLYGMPVDWSALEALALKYGTILIEDAAQGHGATWHGRPLGALAEISTLSFGRGKGWTGGGGGAVLFRRGGLSESDVPDASQMTEARTLAGLVAQWTLGRPSVYGIPHSIPALGLGETTFHPPVTPVLMPRGAAAAALEAGHASREEAARRRANARWFLDRMLQRDWIRSIRPTPDAESGYLRLPTRIARGLGALESPARARALGVAPSYPRTLAELAPRLTGPERHWPGADELARDLVTLPTHSRLTAVERDEIVRMLHQKPR